MEITSADASEASAKATVKTASIDTGNADRDGHVRGEDFFGVEEDPFGNTRLGFEATGKINRTDFGVDFQAPLNSGGVLVSEKIGIEIEGSAIKQA